MASYQINHYVDLPFGKLHIYADPNQSRKAEKLIKETPQILWEAWRDAGERYGKEIVKKAKECVLRGMPPKGVSWPPLSPKYIKVMGGDTNIYYKSAQYYEGIGVHRENMYYAKSYGGGFARPRYFIGLPNGVLKWPARYKANTRKPLTLQQVAYILEVGSSKAHIPPRPLWKPLFESHGGNKKIELYVKNAIKRQLTKYMI